METNNSSVSEKNNPGTGNDTNHHSLRIRTLEAYSKTIEFLCSPRIKLYASYGFSSAGSRMWNFAVALGMVRISDDLRLTAISMAINGTTVLLFGAGLGRWIDRNPRFRAAVSMLVVNNAAIVVSASSLVALLYFGDAQNEALKLLLILVVIVFGALSLLALQGSSIIVCKDWVVEMAKGDHSLLARMNATLVAISQAAMIIAPIIVGQIMTSFQLPIGCLFIAVWNICSFGVEFYLLRAILAVTPELLSKPKSLAVPHLVTNESSTNTIESHNNSTGHDRAYVLSAFGRLKLVLRYIKSSSRNLAESWKIYSQQTVFPAALALSFLYMTVLGLDGMTTGYAYAQGMPENLLAVVRGVGATLGIAGSFVFPLLQNQVGLRRTGLISLALQVVCTSLCVVSIALPGSPFNLVVNNKNTEFNLTTTAISANNELMTTTNVSSNIISSRQSMCSIWTFLAGAVLARFGLWMADLAIGQLMQESIAAEQRGVANGVQNSAQQGMAMLMSFLGILLPMPSTFGILILISFFAISSALISYTIYYYKQQQQRQTTDEVVNS